MAYIFKKVNQLFPTAGEKQGDSGSAVEGAPAGQQQVSTGSQANPYQSDFRNFSKLYESNKEQPQAQVQTDIGKNIAEQNQNMAKSSETYRGGLQNIANQYQYKPEDVQDVGNDESYGRLSSVLNTTPQKAQLQNVSSNTSNYAPDTQSLAQASTTGGLSSLLQKQYGTTQGQSRLDSLLSRASGGAGESIRNNLQDLGQFREQKQNALGAEASQLQQLQQQADAAAQQAKTDLLGKQTQYGDEATSAMTADKTAYEQLYGQEQKRLEDLLASGSKFNDIEQKRAIEALTAAFKQANPKFGPTGDRLTSVGLFGIPDISNWQAPVDTSGMAPSVNIEMPNQGMPNSLVDRSGQDYATKVAAYLKANPNLPEVTKYILQNQIAAQAAPERKPHYIARRSPTYYAPKYDLSGYMGQQAANQLFQNFNPNIENVSGFIETPDQYSQAQYLDPRYNKIAQLLGTDMTPLESRQDNQVTTQDLAGDLEQRRMAYLQSQLGNYVPGTEYTPVEGSSSIIDQIMGFGDSNPFTKENWQSMFDESAMADGMWEMGQTTVDPWELSRSATGKARWINPATGETMDQAGNVIKKSWEKIGGLF